MIKSVLSYYKSILFTFIYIGAFSGPIFAQKYFQMTEENFGKTKMQYQKFNWRTIKTRNFEVNFYRGGETLGKKAAIYAESDFQKITETLGYSPFSTLKIFVFNSLGDLDQTNIGLVLTDEINQRQENFSKSRVLVSYQKSDSLFKQTLIKEISSLYLYDMLYGGNIKESAQNQLLLSLPDWFTLGISAYLAESDNSLKFDAFKKTILATKNRKMNLLSGEQATLVGQSIWNYIGLKYGKDNISNIINLTRIIRSEQASITSSLGISYPRFIEEWRAFYVDNTGLQKEEPIATEPQRSPQEKTETLRNLKPGEVDTDNYEFNIENINKYNNKKTQNVAGEEVSIEKTKETKSANEIQISSTKAYKNFLVKANSSLGVKFDPIRKFGLTSTIVYNDLLENNVFMLTGFLKPASPLLKNYDFSVEYANFTNKIDWKIKYEKRSFDMVNVDNSISYILGPLNQTYQDSITYFSNRLIYQKLSTTFIYPLRDNLKLEGSPGIIKSTLMDYELNGNDNQNNYYGNATVNLVYDDTKRTSWNTELGTKIKFTIDNNYYFGNKNENFNRFNLDARHYRRLFKGLVFAARLNYGTSRGNSPKYSFLGGVENAVNRTVYANDNQLPGQVKDFRNILFYNYPGNLRGFDFARLYGNNYILTNLELRFSFAEYFPQAATGSSFLNNLQFILFDDIGTAWTGKNGPFSKQNSLNTTQVGDPNSSPFFATVTTFKNPFLMGFGGGIHSSVFGFLLKADYGLGLEDKVLNKRKLQISLGKNF